MVKCIVSVALFFSSLHFRFR